MSKRVYFGTDGVRGKANALPMTAEFALKFKKTHGRQPLTETNINELVNEVQAAISDITAAGMILKHECKKA